MAGRAALEPRSFPWLARRRGGDSTALNVLVWARRIAVDWDWQSVPEFRPTNLRASYVRGDDGLHKLGNPAGQVIGSRCETWHSAAKCSGRFPRRSFRPGARTE